MSIIPNTPPPNWQLLIQGYLDNDLAGIAIDCIKKWNLQIEIRDGKICDKANSTEYWLKRFITVDAQMLVMKDDVRKLSKVDDEVLIVGETGTGKELIAHALMGDREGKFIAVNCAGLPDTLIESLLFGHLKGTFTGATESRKGLCAQANGGILFLDEIGELPMTLQSKLLRAIQEKKILPLGAGKEEDISCRFVFATHRDINAMIIMNQFREDLYARISTFEIKLKPLKDRLDDIYSIIGTLDGGKELLAILNTKCKSLNTSLNVRSLQQYVRRFKVLGKLPL